MDRIGTTIRSWNSSTDSAMRPSGAAARCWSIRICITTAVEDSARHSPSTMPPGGVMPLQAHDQADRDGRGDHLDEPDAEHVAAQLPQPLQRQFEAEQEQQEHDAEFGQRLGALGIIEGDVLEEGKLRRQRAEPERPERQADEQKAEHGADAQPMQQRHDDAGRHQEYQKRSQAFGVQHDIPRQARQRAFMTEHSRPKDYPAMRDFTTMSVARGPARRGHNLRRRRDCR